MDSFYDTFFVLFRNFAQKRSKALIIKVIWS